MNNISVQRHCMVVHAYYPLGEIRVQREARALRDSGLEVDVICLQRSDEPSRDEEFGVQIYRLPVRRHKEHGALVQLLEYLAFFMLASWQLLKLHLKHRYATIQIHNLPDFLVFAAVIPKLLGARVILDLHDLMPEFYAARFGTDTSSLPVKLVILQERFSCRFADHVITVTEAWRQTLIERGVPADKCSVVMNLPDPAVFETNQNGPAMAEKNGKFRVFYHGNVSHRYGLDNLVTAFANVRRQRPDVNLMIHGRGDFQPELEALVNQFDLNKSVTLSSDLIPLEDVVSLIKTADLAVVPYRYDIFTDGILPTKLMEYAALGISTIASETAAIKSYFSAEMVCFVPPNDVDALAEAMLGLIDDRGRLNRLSQNITGFHEQYNWRSESKQYVRLVRSLARTG